MDYSNIDKAFEVANTKFNIFSPLSLLHYRVMTDQATPDEAFEWFDGAKQLEHKMSIQAKDARIARQRQSCCKREDKWVDEDFDPIEAIKEFKDNCKGSYKSGSYVFSPTDEKLYLAACKDLGREPCEYIIKGV